MCPWPSGKSTNRHPCRSVPAAFQAGKAGSIPAGHSHSFGDRLMVGHLPLKQRMRVQFLLPEPFALGNGPKAQLMRGRLTGRTGPSERPDVGSIPAPATCKRPRRVARSARHPVTVEIVGSNPIGDAFGARYANWQSGERPPLGRWCPTFAFCGFNSHPCYSHMRRLGIGKPQWL